MKHFDLGIIFVINLEFHLMIFMYMSYIQRKMENLHTHYCVVIFSVSNTLVHDEQQNHINVKQIKGSNKVKITR